jgi:hypothetical protein
VVREKCAGLEINGKDLGKLRPLRIASSLLGVREEAEPDGVSLTSAAIARLTEGGEPGLSASPSIPNI